MTAGLQSLADCAQSRQRINALFLIDESGSLKETDPTNQRVVAVKSALAGLQSLSATSKGTTPVVQVMLAGFGVDFETLSDWRTLTAATVSELQHQAEALAERNTARDTDYYVALDAARQQVDAQAAKAGRAGKSEPCTVLLWFTDGKYDVEDRLAPGADDVLSKYYAPDIGLDQPGSGARAVQRGKELLCAPDGVVDMLRDAQVSIAPVVLTTQIAPDDQSFLQAVAGGGCGTHGTPDAGDVFSAADVASAILSFDRAVGSVDGATTLPAAPVVVCITHRCGEGTHSFDVGRAVSSFRVVVVAPQAGSDVEVAVPATKHRFRVRSAKNSTTTLGGVSLRARWSSPTVLVLTCEPAGKARQPIASSGKWSLVVIGHDESSAGTAQVQLSLVTDVLPVLTRTPVLRAGEEALLSVVLEDRRGRRVKPDTLGIDSVTVAGSALDPTRPNPDALTFAETRPGRFATRYAPAADSPSSSIDVELRAMLTVENGVALAPVVRTYELPVAPPAGYPSVDTGVLVLHPDRGRSSATGRLTVSGGTAPGCVRVEQPEVDVAPEGAGAVTFATRPGPGNGACIRVDAGKRLAIDVRATPEQAVSGTARASFKLAVSPLDSSNPVAISVSTRMRFAAPKQSSDRSCLAEGVVIAGRQGISVVEECELHSVTSDGPVRTAFSDGQGGFVFQGPLRGDLYSNRAASPIEHIDRHGNRSVLLTDDGTEQLELLDITGGRTPRLLYRRTNNVVRDPRSEPGYFTGTFDVEIRIADLDGSDDTKLASTNVHWGTDEATYVYATGANGKVLVVGREIQFGWLELRNVDGGTQELADNPFQRDGPYGVPFLVDAALSPDGATYATVEQVGFSPRGGNEELVVRDMDTGTERARLPYTSRAVLAFDGRRVAVSAAASADLSSSIEDFAVAPGTITDTKTGARADLPVAGTASFAPDRVRARTTTGSESSNAALSDSQVLNSLVPAGVCGDGKVGWNQSTPIQLSNGEGESRDGSGAATGPSVQKATIVGRADFDGDGRGDVLVSVYCSGGTIAQCCAGRSSHAEYAYALTTDADGVPKMIGDVIRAGQSLPGDRYGPAARDIRQISLDERGQVVTREYIYYPEQYTSAEVGGVDPSADVEVVHIFQGGHWRTR